MYVCIWLTILAFNIRNHNCQRLTFTAHYSTCMIRRSILKYSYNSTQNKSIDPMFVVFVAICCNKYNNNKKYKK